MRIFPLISDDPPYSIPWEMIEPHRMQAAKNHSQSIETLAKRGGLSFCELLATIEGRDLIPWITMTEEESRLRVIEKIEQFEKSKKMFDTSRTL